MIERETHPEAALVVHGSRLRFLALGLLGLVLAAVGVGMAVSAPGIGGRVFAVCCAAMFGTATVAWVSRALRRRPVLRVTGAGVTDTSVVGAAGFVPWERIGPIEMKSLGSGTFLVVAVRGVEGLNAAQRGMARGHRALGGSVINVPRAMLPARCEELIAEIESLRPADDRPAPGTG